MKVTFPPKLEFLSEPHRYKVLYGGRGGIKSWSVAQHLLLAGAKQSLRIPCARETMLSIREKDVSAVYRTMPASLPYLIEDLKALRVEISSFRDLDPNSSNFFDLTGQEVEMWCSHEDGTDGELREKWGVARQGGPKKEAIQSKPLDAAKLRSLDNLFGKALKELAPKQQGPRPAPATQQSSPNGNTTWGKDDGVPF